MKWKLNHSRKCLLKKKQNNLWFLFLKMGLSFNVITFLPVTAFLSSLQSTFSFCLVGNTVKYNIFSASLFIDVVWCQAGHCGCDSLKFFVWIVMVEGLISLDTGDLCFSVHCLCFFSHLFFSSYQSSNWCIMLRKKRGIIRCIKICGTNSRI